MYTKSRALREALLASKMRHWYAKAQRAEVDGDVATRRTARRNYWKLVRAHPHLAAKHGWTEEKILLTDDQIYVAADDEPEGLKKTAQRIAG